MFWRRFLRVAVASTVGLLAGPEIGQATGLATSAFAQGSWAIGTAASIGVLDKFIREVVKGKRRGKSSWR